MVKVGSGCYFLYSVGGQSIIGVVGSLVAYSSLHVHVTVQLQVTSELFGTEPYGYMLAIMNFILSVRLLIWQCLFRLAGCGLHNYTLILLSFPAPSFPGPLNGLGNEATINIGHANICHAGECKPSSHLGM